MKTPWRQKILIWFFFAAFGAAAMFLLVRYVQVISFMHHTEHWVSVPAHIEEWDFHTTSTSSAGRPGSSSKPMHRITGTYSYTWNGQNYTSSLLGPLKGSDNFSSHYRRMLVAHLHEERPAALVNPLAPSQSTLTRLLPWEHLLFTAVFLIFPCGFVSFAALATVCLPVASWLPSFPRRLWGGLHGSLLLPIIWWGFDHLTPLAWVLVFGVAILTGACVLWPGGSRPRQT